MRGGRPLRFLALTVGGWTGLRVALLWPTIESVPELIRAIAPPALAATRPQATPAMRAVSSRRVQNVNPTTPAIKPVGAHGGDPSPVAATPAAMAIAPNSQAVAMQPPPLRPAPFATPPRRLAGSVWTIMRDGRSDAFANGQLGGSQVGARLTYALGESRRIALAARVSAPLRGRSAEAALGLDWRPTRLPVHVIAEQRFALGRGRGGPTLMAIGGLDPTPVTAGFRLEAYGQAGVIARGQGEGFADGAARLTRPIARIGAARLDLGVGAWGGAQRGAARLDTGPTLGVAAPVAGRTVRLTLDWRERVAGSARPGSGPALSLGTDF